MSKRLKQQSQSELNADTNFTTPTKHPLQPPIAAVTTHNHWGAHKKADDAMVNNPLAVHDEESGMEMASMKDQMARPASSPGSGNHTMPSTPSSSSLGLHQPVLEYRPTRCNGCWRFMRRHPRTCGALATFVVCVLPLLVTTGLLAGLLGGAPGKRGGHGSGGSDGDPVWTDFIVHTDDAAVATDDARCSRIGRDVLLRGGSAIDAAVAATLCLGVVSPGSSGIGGGCFILTHNGTTRENVFIDSREVAPAAARADMFVGAPLKAQDGGLAVGVFSELKGLHLAWSKHGRLPWNDLVQPAAQLAQRWTVSKETAALLQQVVGQLHSGLYPGLSALYVKADGSIKKVGDVVEQPLLADTLAKVGRFGPDYLYTTMAPTLEAEIRAAGGVVTAADMQAYAPEVLQPLTASFMGHTYVGASGSSSGGIAVAAVLEFLGGYPEPLASAGDVFYHRLVEAFNHIFAMRLSLADPSFVNTTGVTRAMLSAPYMAALRAATSDRSVMPHRNRYGGRYNLTYAAQQTAGAGALPTDHGTTHVSVLDRWGNAVALTSTINTYFGSKVVSPSTGVLFNNQMDDFSVPGASNFFGLAPSALNYPLPGKRPLSSMSPSFVLLPPLATDSVSGKGAKLRLIGGGSGGPKIITVTTQMIVNVIGRGLDLLSAVMVPRLHAQLLPPLVYAEDHTLVSSDALAIRVPAEVRAALRARGHNVTSEKVIGITQFISIDPETGAIAAVSDPRKDGRPAATVPSPVPGGGLLSSFFTFF